MVASSTFAQALRDPAAPVPAGLVADARRFAVYRNNVAVGLIGVLEARHPALRRIVGDAFFRELARGFIERHPPRSPVMIAYGDGFADDLDAEPGLEALPYLADVARLEAARLRAYHAADAEPLEAAAFASVRPEALDGLQLTLHPSLGVVRSSHPIVTIWAMNADEAEFAPIEDWVGEDALVLRPAFDVHVRALPAGAAAFIEALAQGRSLGAAADAALSETPTFDLARNLVGLVEAGAVVAFQTETPSESPQ